MKPQLRLIKSKQVGSTLSSWRDDYLDSKRVKLEAKTIDNYRKTINLYIEFVGETYWPPIRFDVIRFLDDVMKRSSQITVFSYWAILRAWFNYMAKLGAFGHFPNPAEQITQLGLAPRNPKLSPKGIPRNDIDKLFAYLRALPDGLLNARDLALIHFVLIEAQEVINDVTDRNQLSPMALAAQEMLELDQGQVVADMGYSHGQELKTCVKAGLEPYVVRPNPSANRKLGLFGKEQFVYEPETDSYCCPAGESLTFRFDTVEKGRHIRYYQTSACGHCALKAQCTRNKQGRRITRWVDEHILEETQRRVEAHPEIMQKRKELVEHPFGTLKHWWDQGHFLTCGLPKVRAEFSLSALAYNIRRVLNIVGVQGLIATLGQDQVTLFGSNQTSISCL